MVVWKENVRKCSGGWYYCGGDDQVAVASTLVRECTGSEPPLFSFSLDDIAASPQLLPPQLPTMLMPEAIKFKFLMQIWIRCSTIHIRVCIKIP